MQKKKTRSLSLTIHKINSKWIKDIIHKSEIMKLLQENIVEALQDIGIDNDFLDRIPKGHKIKVKIDK
jgi:hypothetical protein